MSGLPSTRIEGAKKLPSVFQLHRMLTCSILANECIDIKMVRSRELTIEAKVAGSTASFKCASNEPLSCCRCCWMHERRPPAALLRQLRHTYATSHLLCGQSVHRLGQVQLEVTHGFPHQRPICRPKLVPQLAAFIEVPCFQHDVTTIDSCVLLLMFSTAGTVAIIA